MADKILIMRVFAVAIAGVLTACASATRGSGGADTRCYGTGVVGNPRGDSLSVNGLSGAWAIDLRRSGFEAPALGRARLEPKHREAGALHLNHTWYDVAQGPFDIDLGEIGLRSPSASTMYLLQRGDSVGAMMGSTLSIVESGDVVLEGAWRGSMVQGRWWQLAVPGCQVEPLSSDAQPSNHCLQRTGANRAAGPARKRRVVHALRRCPQLKRLH
jgi:hypothetical protein